jgi:arginine decarboxylase-like protein
MNIHYSRREKLQHGLKNFNDGNNFSAISTHKQYDCLVLFQFQQGRKAYLKAGLEAGAKAEAEATMAAKQNTVFIIFSVYCLNTYSGKNCELCEGFSLFFY